MVPAGNGVRVDSHIESGYRIPTQYDSLIAKLCVHAPTRQQAITKMQAALSELTVTGILTNKALHQAFLADEQFAQGGSSIHYLAEWLAENQANLPMNTTDLPKDGVRIPNT